MVVAWGGVQGYLAVDVNASATSITVGFDTGFPSAPFDFTIGLERLTCTAKSGTGNTTWTVTRGINGTPADVHYGGPDCGIAEVRHQFIVTNPTGGTIDLTAIAETATCSWTIPGGDAQAIIGFHTYDPTRYFPDPEAKLVMSSNESGSYVPYWSGYLNVPKERRLDDDGYHYDLTFTGFSDTLGDDMYLDTTAPTPGFFDSGHGWWTAFTAIHTVIQDALRDIGGLFVAAFDWTHIVDGGQQIGKELNGQWKSCLQLLNELCAQGDTGEALDWAVFTDTDGVPKLWLYRRSRWLGINIPWSSVKLPADVPLSWNVKDQKTAVAIKYASGTMVAAGGVPGRRKVWLRDLSNTVQDSYTAFALAQSILSEASILQTLTESPIVLEYKADDPSTLYLTDQFGAEVPIWRGNLIAGRKATITGISATNAKWPLSPMQVKSVSVDHVTRKTTCQMGRYVDWIELANQYNFQNQQNPASPTHIPGASSSVVIPPANGPQNGAVTMTGPPLGPMAGGIGTHLVMPDLDMAPPQWCYSQLDGSALPEGRYDDYSCRLAGHLLGFHFRGTSALDVASSGTFEIKKGTGAGSPTTISTISVASAILGEDIFPDDGVVDLAPGDYLRLFIITNDPSTGFAHITIDGIFRRTGGSDRPVSTAAAVFLGVSTVRDPNGGIITFNITTDRPCRAWVAFDTQAGPYRSVTGTSENLSKNPKCQSYWVPGGVLMHGVVHMLTADNVASSSADFTF